ELRRHAGTQFDPDLVSLFCDLFATHAPSPDPTVAAMTAGTSGVQHRHGPARRRRRRAPAATDETGSAAS
ncbi:MAG TPA: hypothetical protein VFJ71_03970, partial [Candidatus Limnocylindrales bacterium]|nr:hypothetical protein [Candidatus Limnocylindrales bacterium]